MRRIAIMAFAAAGLLAFVFSTGASHGGKPPRYSMVFDNASGLVEGADFRVGGVAVGSIESFDIAPQARAKVEVSVSDTSFGAMRSDAFCKIAQQSLIGEYYIECEPGVDGRPLEPGATIPVKQTASPIASDLVQNIMRRPYRERFSIILSELGAGFASRGEDINETIRRSIPALRETNRVLELLADNRKVLRRLAADSGVLNKKLGKGRDDVTRFVTQAGETASVTAERREALAATFRQFPGFLDELTPTLRDLGTTAREMTPALADLRAAAPSVTSLFDTLPPFARASEPAVVSLGAASTLGRTAVRESAGTVAALSNLGGRTAEPAKNLAIITKDLDDRDRAVEKDPDSPGGAGYTGLEAILQYPFDQSLAINIFDTRGYLLKVSALINECTSYTDDEDAQEDPERTARCNSWLGPNQPGVTTPDPTESGSRARRSRSRKTPAERAPSGLAEEQRDAQPQGGAGDDGTTGSAPDLLDRLPDLLRDQKPVKPVDPNTGLLDFLLGT